MFNIESFSNMNFKSDNAVAVSNQIMEAIIQANHGFQNSYGLDEYSIKLQKKFSEIFEKEVWIYLTSTGTAANALGLSSLVKPYESILCHKEAHINTDECGAPILFSGGSNLLLVDGKEGKIDIKHLDEQIKLSQSQKPHGQKPGCISITQATECGTTYSLQELEHITEISKKYLLPVHMDGARFANSLIYLKCTPSKATWQSGVDVMSFGGTKNGCLNAEAIVFFNLTYAKDFEYIHKKAGQLMSKTRFFATQFLSYFEEDLWLNNAKHANSMAQSLKTMFNKHNIEVQYPVEANEVFVVLGKELAEYLWQNGCNFYSWGTPNSNLYRFVTSCFTKMIEIEELNTRLYSFILDIKEEII